MTIPYHQFITHTEAETSLNVHDVVSGSKQCVEDRNNEKLSFLKKVFIRLKPKQEDGTDIELMRTATLVQRLLNIDTRPSELESRKQHSNKANYADFYEKLDAYFLKKRLTLLPNTMMLDQSKKRKAHHHSQYSAGLATGNNHKAFSTISMSYKTFLMRLGGRFGIKGSAIKSIEQKDLIKSNNKHKDVDVYIEVEGLDFEHTFGRFIKMIREEQSIRNKSLTDRDILLLYTRCKPDEVEKLLSHENPEKERIVKLRLNVDQAKCIAVDLNFYTALTNSFDRLLGSDQLKANLHDQTVQVKQLINDQTKDWIIAKNYIWLNENMDHGLPRIQKHYSKNPLLTLLQNNVISSIYSNSTVEDKADFLLWILTHRSRGVDDANMAAVFEPTAKAIFDLSSDVPFRIIMKDNIQYVKNRIQSKGICIFVPNEPAQYKPLPSTDNINGYVLLTALQTIPKDFSTFFRECLVENPECFPDSQTVDTLFVKPNLKMLSRDWSESVMHNPFACTLMEPITYALLGEHLFKDFALSARESGIDNDTVGTIASTLINITKHQRNTIVEIKLWDHLIDQSQFNSIDEQKVEHKSALDALIRIAKHDPSHQLIDDERSFFLNTFAKVPLKGSQVQEIKKFFPKEFSLSPKQVNQNKELSDQSKLLILYQQAKEQIKKIDALISYRKQYTPTNLDETFDALFQDHEQSVGYFSTLKTTSDFLLKTLECGQCTHDELSIINMSQMNGLGHSGHNKNLMIETPFHRALISEDYIHVGKIKTHTVNGQKVLSIDGNGLRMSALGVLQIGNFKEGKLSDDKGSVILSNRAYTGQVKDRLLGKGSLYQINNQSLDDLTCIIRHDFQKYFSSDHRRYAFYTDFSDQSIDSLEVGFEQDMSQVTLHIPTTSKGNFTLSLQTEGAKIITQASSHRELYLPLLIREGEPFLLDYTKAVLIDDSINRRVNAPYDIKTHSLRGHGKIWNTATNPQTLLCAGELVDFTSEGISREYSEHCPHGRVVFYRDGKVIDDDLDILGSELKHSVLSKKSIPRIQYPYALPGFNEHALFSLLDEQSNKVFGVWNKGCISGHMNLNRVDGKYSITGDLLFLPAATYQTALKAFDFDFGDMSLTLMSDNGEEYVFFPHGNVDVSVNGDSKTHEAYLFGRKLLGLFVFNSDKTWVAPIDELNQKHCLIGTIGDKESCYIGETKPVSPEFPQIRQPHGQGITLKSHQFFKGTYIDGTLSGSGLSVTPDGTLYRGIFRDNKPVFGEFTLKNGVKITAPFQNDAPSGPAKLIVPAYPKSREFRFSVANHRIDGTIEEKIETDNGNTLWVPKLFGEDNPHQPNFWIDVPQAVFWECKALLEQNFLVGSLEPFEESFQRLLHLTDNDIQDYL